MSHQQKDFHKLQPQISNLIRLTSKTLLHKKCQHERCNIKILQLLACRWMIDCILFYYVCESKLTSHTHRRRARWDFKNYRFFFVPTHVKRTYPNMCKHACASFREKEKKMIFLCPTIAVFNTYYALWRTRRKRLDDSRINLWSRKS